MRKSLFVVLFLLITNSILSQNLNDSWQIGFGAGITRFAADDAAFIGDATIFQVPRFNLTMPISDRVSVDGAVSFNTLEDAGFIKNSASYFSIDGSIRYNLDAVLEKFAPYVFVGGSVVDSERKMTPTINIGAGGIYWISNRIGINPQIYYKHSFEGYESMRSHIQGTLSIIFKLDWFNAFKNGNHATTSGGLCY
ncbi:hypothetical protein SAMN04489761_2950 [Tenacibaculum sp. MAR_2009_124]|uniref:hypothetical protein n=1 Tax=Tenacibaculum sp. MAR_2009_124 TaxID=1250059 RepID=UPI000896EB17|nr:hypothetical protein [Tenacibaculum sp. MAR_2009_124]SEC42268.1 hypothetical protein SAMN04489761_2950 [Tenacibaculum sp. MAR_2009_124]